MPLEYKKIILTLWLLKEEDVRQQTKMDEGAQDVTFRATHCFEMLTGRLMPFTETD